MVGSPVRLRVLREQSVPAQYSVREVIYTRPATPSLEAAIEMAEGVARESSAFSAAIDANEEDLLQKDGGLPPTRSVPGESRPEEAIEGIEKSTSVSSTVPRKRDETGEGPVEDVDVEGALPAKRPRLSEGKHTDVRPLEGKEKQDVSSGDVPELDASTAPLDSPLTAPRERPVTPHGRRPSVLVGVVVEKSGKTRDEDYTDFSYGAKSEATPRPKKADGRRNDQPRDRAASKAVLNDHRPGQSRSHVKFGDDESLGTRGLHSTGPISPKALADVDPTEAGDSSSDDEAPEAETLSAAQQKATERRRRVHQAVRSQEALGRQSRREKDIKLKEQASAQRQESKAQAKGGPSISTTPATLDQSPPEKLMNRDSDPLRTHPRRLAKPVVPDLLPEDILAAEPYRPPLLEDVDLERTAQATRKHVVFDSREKPLKEMRRGPLRVKVLEHQNPSLPPRANRDGRSVREGWLAGKARKGSRAAVERKKVGGGFLRKRA